MARNPDWGKVGKIGLSWRFSEDEDQLEARYREHDSQKPPPYHLGTLSSAQL
jgi:hypothetical protein